MNANTPMLAPEQRTPKTYNQRETQWYFGAHLNQARHNLYLALNELTIRIGGNPIENDDQLQSAKGLTILNVASPNPNELAKAMEYYDKNFPFLFYMQYKYKTDNERDERISLRQKGQRSVPVQHVHSSPTRYFKILTELIVFLNNARNHCNHYTLQPLTIGKELVYLLNDIFDVNVRLIKNRFNLNETQLGHLKRYNGIIGGTKKPNPNKHFWYSFVDSNNLDRISDTGLAFFTCLFLTKGEAYLFLKKLSGFKRSETPEYKATLEVFTSNMLRVPKERLESDNSPQAVFLDMCNELARCPEELFDQLDEEQQKLFITDQGSEENNTEEGPESKMIRKKDRFLYFSQRYLDITKAFPQMRFGVDLGTYFYSIYPKTLAGIDEMRQLTKHLIGYGRLEDFDKDKRPFEIAALYGQKEDLLSPYIRETTPHYQTEGNNIPIYIGNSTSEWPGVRTKDIKGKSYPRKLDKSNALLPYAILSTKEMPALMLYHLLRKEKNKGDDVQKVIVSHINNIKKLFNAVLNGNENPVDTYPMVKPTGNMLQERSDKEYCRRYDLLLQLLDKYDLHPSYIPDKLINYLLCIIPVDWKEKANRRLEEMKAHALELVERMELREKADIKPGKPGFRKVKVGKLAQLLVEDMMLMQPVAKDEKGQPMANSKANGLAYRLLQSHLAYYGVHRENIFEIFKSCKLTDSTNPHPFLHRINVKSLTGIIEFYKEYFKIKAEYLNSCIRDKKYDQYHFLRRTPPSDLKVLLKTYLQTEGPSHSPFNLPRGLFHRVTVKWLMSYGTDINKKFLDDHPETNTVHLVKHLFEQQDKSQEFYRWKRHYHLFSGEVPLFLSLEERQQETERTMKMVKKLRDEQINMETLAIKAKETFYSEIKQLNSLDKIIKYAKTKYGTSFPKVCTIDWSHVNTHFLHKDTNRLVIEVIEEQIKDNKHYINNYKFFIENEKYLRLAEAQDMLLFMAIKDLLKEKIGDISLTETYSEDINTFLLRNIVPKETEGSKSLLNCRPAGGVHMNIDFYEVNENGTFKKEGNNKMKAGTATIVDRHLKIKNAGNFRKLLKDRRINNLCFYFRPDAGSFTINRMVLENELKAYDKQRLNVLEVVAEFEKVLYLNSDEQEKESFLNEGVPEHKLYLQHYFKKFSHNQEDLQKNLLAVRNAFAHNQFPLIQDEKFILSVDEWKMIDAQFQPSVQRSHQGYGIIEKIALYGTNGYKSLIDKINENVRN